jgi:hypothetical protein
VGSRRRRQAFGRSFRTSLSGFCCRSERRCTRRRDFASARAEEPAPRSRTGDHRRARTWHEIRLTVESFRGPGKQVPAHARPASAMVKQFGCRITDPRVRSGHDCGLPSRSFTAALNRRLGRLFINFPFAQLRRRRGDRASWRRTVGRVCKGSCFRGSASLGGLMSRSTTLE